jgi:hypothetical protein
MVMIDMPGLWLHALFGGQLLPNGNVVATRYAGDSKDSKARKLIDVNRGKQFVWTYSDGESTGIHHFQILGTNGLSILGPAMK